MINLGEIGENIVNYIQKLRARIADLEAQREEFKRLYEQAEQKAKELSGSQAKAQRTVRLSKLLEE